MSGLGALAAYDDEEGSPKSQEEQGSLLVGYGGESEDEDDAGDRQEATGKSTAMEVKKESKSLEKKGEVKAELSKTSEPSAKETDPELYNRVVQMLATCKRIGTSITEYLRGQHNHTNPSLLEKLHETYDIDMAGTNFSKDVFDPHGYSENDFYDRLLVEQRKATEKDARAFLRNEGPQNTATMQKRSKWDNPIPSRPDTITAAQQTVARIAQARRDTSVAAASALPSSGNARADLLRFSAERENGNNRRFQ